MASCGSSLTAVCPSCGSSTLAAPASAENAVSRPPRRTLPAGPPPHLAPLLRHWRTSLEGERKHVTVLFADLKGSMELLADRDPEEARKLLDPVLEHMMDAVHRYEGTVNQSWATASWRCSAPPLAHEDHAARACYAALAMQESIRALARELQRNRGPLVEIRVGLNSGEVVVRAIDNDLHMDLSAIGETTHLAARMEEMAPPGAIWLTRATLALAEPLVETSRSARAAVRGRPAPVEVFELVGARVMRRIEVAALRGLTRFVGRETGAEELRPHPPADARRAWPVTAVVGELGIGKSRLLLEFVHAPTVSGCPCSKPAPSLTASTTPYFPVLNLLRQHLALKDGEPVEAVREKDHEHPVPPRRPRPGGGTAAGSLSAFFPRTAPFPTYDPAARGET